MIAAIGDGGFFAVVWGLGETEDLAEADAKEWAEGSSTSWDSGGSAYVEVPTEIAERIMAGEVDCRTLGIHVRVRDGQITDAEVRS